LQCHHQVIAPTALSFGSITWHSVPFYGSSHNPEFIAQGGTMARNAARLKMGYYPLPVSEAARLRSLLNYSGPASVVDPCVGQGTALEIIMQGTEARRYPRRRSRVPGRMRFVPTVVHNSPNLGNQFERWSSQLSAEASCY
jgi:hypothetical protein